MSRDYETARHELFNSPGVSGVSTELNLAIDVAVIAFVEHPVFEGRIVAVLVYFKLWPVRTDSIQITVHRRLALVVVIRVGAVIPIARNKFSFRCYL